MNAAQIQAIIDAATDYCVIPPGVHQIDAPIVVNRTGLRIVASGAVFARAFAPAADSHLLAIVLSDDVTIERLTLDGRNETWGGLETTTHNIGIFGGTNLTLRDIVSRRSPCDGIYVNRMGAANTVCGVTGIGVDVNSEDILLDHVTCDEGYRQGMSLISVDGLTADYCNFLNTGAGPAGETAPTAGVDLEPNAPPTWIPENITFTNCVFRGNLGGQLLCTQYCDTILVEDCSFSEGTSWGISISGSNITLRNVVIDDIGRDARSALRIAQDAGGDIVIEDVLIKNARWGAVIVQDTVKATFTRLTIQDCANFGFRFRNDAAPTPPPETAEIRVRDLTITNLVESAEFSPPTNYAYIFGTCRCPVYFQGYILIASEGIYDSLGRTCVGRGANLNSCDDLRGVDRFYSVGEFATYASYGFTQRNYY